ncbi:hypothetical protein LEP3755_55980 [Leptolyngbya sp. NIES-3755]|nr:hypothetical protein LEP3755_55980 [Leptolyngbya sp. NIES-3755]
MSLVLEVFHTHLLLAVVVVICLALNAKEIISNYLLRQALEKNLPLPKRLQDFPVHNTSTAAYIASFHKVETFMEQVVELGSAELRLNSDDINNIHLKGVPIHKYRINPKSLFYPLIVPKYANEFFHFDIQEAAIVRKRISYPAFEGKDAIRSETLEITFTKVDSEYQATRKCIEWNGEDVEELFRNNPVYQILKSTDLLSSEDMGSGFGISNFLFHLMGATNFPNDNPEMKCDPFVYLRISRVLNKIQSIEIVDKLLVIKCS